MPWGDALLRDLHARLDLPSRARSDVLREVGDDLRDMVETLVAQGVSRDVATERAVRLLHPGEPAVEALAAVHRSPYQHLALRLGPGAARVVERSTVLVMAGLAVAAPIPALFTRERPPAWAALPLLLLAGLMVALLTRETLRWWIRQDLDVRALARTAAFQGGTIVLSLSWGALATALEAWFAAAAWQTTTPSIKELAVWASRSTTLLALALGVAMLGTFGSLALLQALWQARNLEGELSEMLGPSESDD